MSELCRLIKSERAICLRGYASSFDILAKYVKSHPSTFPDLKIIIAGSETLHDDTRHSILTTLKCNVISQYANEECGILAQEMIHPQHISDQNDNNVMYLNHASYFFEFLKLDNDTPASYGEMGRIVITDLHNYAHPIIRYDTGDVGILMPPNKYSNGYPVLGRLYGRKMDVCYSTSNQPISPMAIGRTMKHFDDVLQWQFIQKDQNVYILKVVPIDSNNWNNKSIAVESLSQILGRDAKIQVQLVEETPVLASGKRKMVINEWKQ